MALAGYLTKDTEAKLWMSISYIEEKEGCSEVWEYNPTSAVAVFGDIVDACGKEAKGGRVEKNCVLYSLRAEEKGFGAEFVGVEKKDIEGDYEKATKLGGKVCWKGNGDSVCECGWSKEFSVFAQFRVDAGGKCNDDDAFKDFFG